MSDDRDNMRGAIWPNERRETDRHPHYTGKATIDGVEYFMDAWKRDEGAHPKAPVLRFSFKRKDKQPGAPATNSTDPGQPAGDGFDDSIPF